MNNFEFIAYKPTPADQYMMGIATVRLYGKVVVRYKLVKTKDGAGNFFAVANYTLTEDSGEKKYVPCFMLDSRGDEESLLDFIRDNVNKATQPSRVNPLAAPSARKEAEEQPLPF